MTHADRARELRPLIEKAAESLTDTGALDGIELFPLWEAEPPSDYAFGVRVRYESKLYKCVQSHTSQSNWTPDVTPALWTEVAPPGEIPVWRQPVGAQDSYMIGDKVWYPDRGDTVYQSTMDYNVYAPDVTGWVVVE